MSKFGKLKFGNTRSVARHNGKGSRSVHLPDRAALNDLTGGGNNPTINDYAKSTPSPQDADTPSVMGLGMGAPSIADDQ